MTAMVDDLGQRGDVAAASLIAEAHRRCRACAADRKEPGPVARCEAGAWAAQLLAEHRRRIQPPPANDRPQPAAGEQRRETVIKWNPPTRCDNSGPNCPQAGVDDDGNIYIRDTERPDQVAQFAPEALDALKTAIAQVA